MYIKASIDENKKICQREFIQILKSIDDKNMRQQLIRLSIDFDFEKSNILELYRSIFTPNQTTTISLNIRYKFVDLFKNMLRIGGANKFYKEKYNSKHEVIKLILQDVDISQEKKKQLHEDAKQYISENSCTNLREMFYNFLDICNETNIEKQIEYIESLYETNSQDIKYLKLLFKMIIRHNVINKENNKIIMAKLKNLIQQDINSIDISFLKELLENIEFITLDDEISKENKTDIQKHIILLQQNSQKKNINLISYILTNKHYTVDNIKDVMDLIIIVMNDITISDKNKLKCINLFFKKNKNLYWKNNYLIFAILKNINQGKYEIDYEFSLIKSIFENYGKHKIYYKDFEMIVQFLENFLNSNRYSLIKKLSLIESLPQKIQSSRSIKDLEIHSSKCVVDFINSTINSLHNHENRAKIEPYLTKIILQNSETFTENMNLIINIVMESFKNKKYTKEEEFSLIRHIICNFDITNKYISQNKNLFDHIIALLKNNKYDVDESTELIQCILENSKFFKSINIIDLINILISNNKYDVYESLILIDSILSNSESISNIGDITLIDSILSNSESIANIGDITNLINLILEKTGKKKDITNLINLVLENTEKEEIKINIPEKFLKLIELYLQNFKDTEKVYNFIKNILYGDRIESDEIKLIKSLWNRQILKEDRENITNFILKSLQDEQYSSEQEIKIINLFAQNSQSDNNVTSIILKYLKQKENKYDPQEVKIIINRLLQNISLIGEDREDIIEFSIEFLKTCTPIEQIKILNQLFNNISLISKNKKNIIEFIKNALGKRRYSQEQEIKMLSLLLENIAFMDENKGDIVKFFIQLLEEERYTQEQEIGMLNLLLKNMAFIDENKENIIKFITDALENRRYTQAQDIEMLNLLLKNMASIGENKENIIKFIVDALENRRYTQEQEIGILNLLLKNISLISENKENIINAMNKENQYYLILSIFRNKEHIDVNIMSFVSFIKENLKLKHEDGSVVKNLITHLITESINGKTKVFELIELINKNKEYFKENINSLTCFASEALEIIDSHKKSLQLQ